MAKHRKLRRCFHCAIQLRWWQPLGCRPCSEALRLNKPSAPYFANSRRNDDPKAPPRKPSHGFPTEDVML